MSSSPEPLVRAHQSRMFQEFGITAEAVVAAAHESIAAAAAA